ncbi:sentrin-specific protease 2 [Corythoichthys intestinalis]|uniref:sentrin-specific protease 2 n=1 Tax=Corythoichthys intestinalis TaxID=161448 RepID=UPI0025A4E6F7|nr:sentrin-specific protease 2 [Corythoichthys intestinalis]
MYGWIFDGISSLFEPATGQNSQANNGELTSTLARRRESHDRPAKRNYQSVDAEESVGLSEHVAAKRRRRDVVVNFVKKTVAGVASLLRLRKPQISSPNVHGHLRDTQPGIDELHTPWLNSPEWRMDKPGIAMGDKAAPTLFQRSLPPLMKKFSKSTASSERRDCPQLLPSRAAVNVGKPKADHNSCNGFGHNRCHRPSLTVEEAIKQNDKEHYRRLLEMVTEKYSKSQPLPFNQTKPQTVLLSDSEHSMTWKSYESGSKAMKYSANNPGIFSLRHMSSNKGRWAALPLSKSYTEAQDDMQHKPVADLDISTEVATRLNLVDRVTPTVAAGGSHTLAPHVRHTDDVPRLTKEMAVEVCAALAQSDPNLVLSAAFKLRITQRDLATLQEGGWLNDEVINFYLSLVMEKCSDPVAGMRVYSFSTFFYPKLCGPAGGHAAVKRWTKAVDIFLYDFVLVPLHLGVHWALAVMDLNAKTLKLYDSMGQRHDDICHLLLVYLKDEHRAKKGRELDCGKWVVSCMRPSEIPQQKNGSDCGVFACKYAQYIAQGRPLTFSQWHMPLFRKLMIWEILHQKLL